MIEQKDTTSKLKEFRRKYRQELRFVLLFTTLLVGFFMLINNKTVADNVVLPITVAETYVASLVLNTAWVGYPNRQRSNVLIGTKGNSFRMEVKNNCNGVYESIVFLVAFIAIQIPWRRKIGWVLFGFTLFHIVNEMRLVSLFIIGSSYSHETFKFFHETFWQYMLVIVTLGIFLFCAHQVSKKSVSRTPELKEST